MPETTSTEPIWYRLELLVNDAEPATTLLWDCGALGVEVQDTETFMEGNPMAPLPDGKTRLIAFFEHDPDTIENTEPTDDQRAVAALTASNSEPEIISYTRFTDRSWETAWKDFFKPLALSKRVMVGPPWETFEAPKGGTRLIIEPGMAFGTGTHETTQLCAQIMDDLLAARPADAAPASLFDVGCGSGILAMAARRLGAQPVLGIDNDAVAVGVANDNLVVNSLQNDMALTTTPLEDVTEIFDIVVANILPHVLLDLRDDLLARTVPGTGKLILSGITEDKAAEVIAGFSQPGWQHVEQRQAGEWVALLFEQTSEQSSEQAKN